jgi:hypothetical protein
MKRPLKSSGRTTVVLIIAVLGSITSCQAPGEAGRERLPPGMVGWWAGEGDARDKVGSNHGVPEGALRFETGKIGQAFSFNGIDADVRVPVSASLDVGSGVGLTFEVWMKPTDVSTQRPVLEWNNNEPETYLWIGVKRSNGEGGPGSFYTVLRDATGEHHFLNSGGGVVQPSIYQHVAATYDRMTGKGVLYFNGAPLVTRDLGVFIPMTKGSLYLGFRPAGGGKGARFVGQLDEVRVYNRPLSPAEIRSSYDSGGPGN